MGSYQHETFSRSGGTPGAKGSRCNIDLLLSTFAVMRRFLISLLSLSVTLLSCAQTTFKTINEKEVQRIETILSADNMQGRKTFTAGSEKAADFISNEFKEIGLKTFGGTNNYKQNFVIIQPKLLGISAFFDNKSVDSENVIIFTCSPNVKITEKSGFKKVYLKHGDAIGKNVSEYIQLKENLLVFVDNSFANNFRRLASRKQYLFPSDKTVVFVLGNYAADNFIITAKNEIAESQTTNVISVLPGKSKKNEFVIFSAHYDHLGTGEAVGNDSIYNGANDDASGVTAVISLAKYYKQSNNNERTLIFAAFTAEEIGGYGSQYFSRQLDPEKTVAMFNIEMIGTESKWGNNSAYITCFDKSNLGKIMQKNLQGSRFTFYPDPYSEQNLFYRSDNATLARLGVPAHTVSTSKMDNEPNYHKPSDEVKTLDINNMTWIIQSLAISAKSIINGRDTPERVKKDQLR